ncbi:MAG: hypothetical protein ACYTG0_23220, partial [Planctomycetota bacterium]
MHRLLLSVIAASIWVGSTEAGQPRRNLWTLEVTLGGRAIEGAPLAWSQREIVLLARDGRLWDFAPDEVEGFRKTSSRFQSYSPSEIRAILLRELGGEYEVTGTSHYLVAHPRGERSRWPDRFEDLYRSFVHFFSVRGFELEEPICPLIGIVCQDRREFVEYSARHGLPAGLGVL